MAFFVMTCTRQTWHWCYPNCPEPSERVCVQLMSSHQSFRYPMVRISSTDNVPSYIEVFVKFQTGISLNNFPDEIIDLSQGATQCQHVWTRIKTVAPVALSLHCRQNGDHMTNLNIANTANFFDID